MAENQHSETWRAFARDRIAHYSEQRGKALEAVRYIESGNVEFFFRAGDGPERNVTAERLADEQRVVKLMDDMIKLYEADLA